MSQIRWGFAIAGLILAVLCVALDSRTLGWCAMAFLTIALLIRLLLRKQEMKKGGVEK
jgi:hypothetical protein